MRVKSRTWFLISLGLFLAAGWFWHLGEERNRTKRPAREVGTSVTRTNAASAAPVLAASTNVPGKSGRFAYRVTNTEATIGQLSRNPNAVLLRNALIDTSSRRSLNIPAHLRAEGDPKTFIVQSRGVISEAFRNAIRQVGATIVSYIPNNAYLVRGSAEEVGRLSAYSSVQSVLPFEPYYKLELPLLELAAQAKPLAEETLLKLTAFPGEKETSKASLDAMGIPTVGEDRSPFGPILIVRPNANSLVALAKMPMIQEIETYRKRALLNDLTRVRIGVSTNTVDPGNYLGLTGSNVLVNVNDTGIDSNHPDLVGRVFADSLFNLSDYDGHGTHVAGIIASSGLHSPTVVSNDVPIPGSVPGADFRGQAPAAKLFAMFAFPDSGPLISDAYLQENAARTNAFISNNSWGYVLDNTYNSAAASYDAAVRDALPEMSGSQPLLYVFAAGNAGFGNNEGGGGEPDSISAPGTAKNVITVGAVENFRPLDPTNKFFGFIDSSNQVASYSSRGNVGVGVEGEFGRFKPDVVAPGSFIVSTRSTNTPPSTDLVISNMDYVLVSGTNGNDRYYRYETGTSMAAPAVSGALALMQEFFEQRLGKTNSPALMKALLINGARSLGIQYDAQVNNFINYQGWGLINLTNSIPEQLLGTNATEFPMQMIDQNPTNALATGESQTRYLRLADDARSFPLRITLVWTDPPGNPVASLKLVNDLDLIVTNLDTGEVFSGNNFGAGTDFTVSLGTNLVGDVVNNVENIYLNSRLGRLGTNYSVTVAARRVNVNAVTAHPGGIVQDYAMVISTENPNVAAPLTLTEQPIDRVANANVRSLQNGIPLLIERAGANPPLLVSTNGATNQWRFYVFTNTFGYGTTNLATNVAFATFLPPNVSRPRLADGEADIDLYVSVDPGLTNLDVNALSMADKSTNRGGTEAVILTNSPPGTVYYVGVKSEDQQGGEFGIFAVSSDQPFSQRDGEGNVIIRGIPVPIDIPDGTPEIPGRALIFGFTKESDIVRRVVVTNGITHQLLGDLVGEFNHNRKSVDLNNHTLNNNQPSGSFTFIYDDSDEGDILDARHSDGPGTLLNFLGEKAAGVWLMNMTDNAANHTGRVDQFTIRVEPSQTNGNNFNFRTIQANRFFYDFVDVPLDATNLTVVVTNRDPVEVYLGQGYFPNRTVYDKYATINPPGGALMLGFTDVPPLTPGITVIGFYNPNPFPIRIGYKTILGVSLNPVQTNIFNATNLVTLIDDARTNSTILITNNQRVVDVEVGVTLRHPRVSDLAITLISPDLERILLMENRGGTTSNGFTGIFTEQTNHFPIPIKFAVPPFTTNGTGGSSTTNTLVFTSSFEVGAGPTPNGGTVDGWTVTANSVEVITNPLFASDGNSALALSSGRIGRTISTVPGVQYTLNYAVRDAGIVSWWKAEGNYLDSIGSNNGSPLFGPLFAPGKVGTAFSLDGSDDKINVADSPSLKLTDALTIEGWIFARGTGIPGRHAQILIRADDRGALDPYYLAMENDGSLQFHIENNLGVIANLNGPPISLNQWHHVAGVFDSVPGTMRIMVDGIVVAQVNTPVIPIGDLDPASNPGVGIGNHGAFVNNQPFSGLIDELSIYKRALSDTELRAIFAAGPAGKAGPASPSPYVSIALPGISTNYTLAMGTWQTNTITFTAQGASTTLELAGNPLGVLLDSINLTQLASTNLGSVSTNRYYLPEESLKNLVGDRATGLWQLEVWDTRVGAPVGDVDWFLHLTFPPPINPATVLYNNGSSTNTITGGEVKYFYIDVPPLAGFATNTLVSLTGGGINLDFNQNGLPGITPGTTFAFIDTPSTATRVLTTNGPPPQLVPGQRYYLAARNDNPTETNQFVLTVSFDQDFVTNINVTPLTNGVLLSTNIFATNALDYFQFDVSTNAIGVTFEILHPSGDVDLVVRRGLPLPNPTSYDYHSTNPRTNDELIFITTNSAPVPLSPGRYYLGVYNLETNAVMYSIRATEQTTLAVTNVIDLIPDVPTNGVAGPGSVLTNFYRLVVTNSAASDLYFSLFNLTGDVDLVVRRDRLPSVGEFDYRSRQTGTNNEGILISTNSINTNLAGIWYLGVPNNTGSNVNFTVFASIVTNGIVTGGPGIVATTNVLQNGISSPGSVGPRTGPITNYYLFNIPVTTNAQAALFELFGLSGDADLAAGPEGQGFTLLSSSPGTNDERIVIRQSQLGTNFFGNWILAVINREASDVTYTIQATISTNGVFASEGQPRFTTYPRLNAQGLYEFTFESVANERYEIQSTSDFITWTTDSTVTARGSQTNFTDPNPPSGGSRFYRIRQLF